MIPDQISVDEIHLVPKERALSSPLHESSLAFGNGESFIHFSPNI
jgi:hypothetical protein